MRFAFDEIEETIRMVQAEKLDIRTITMGINLRDCVSDNVETLSNKIYDKITKKGKESRKSSK